MMAHPASPAPQTPPAIFVSAGGTGGGIYPALAAIEALRTLAPDVTVHYIGSYGGMEETLVPRGLVASYQRVQAGPVNGVGLLRALSSLAKIAWGTLTALRLLWSLRPRALFMTGGWVTLPVAAACWMAGVPIVIFTPDIEPAQTIKVVSKFARLVLTTTPDSARYFRHGTPLREVGYPLRAELFTATRAQALITFGLDPAARTLLITGGSRGARSLNQAIAAIVPDLLADRWQIIHISGELDADQVASQRARLTLDQQARYHVYPYLKQEMGLALAAADLVVSRAGASSLGEYPHFGLPAILVPYPYAWRYQQTNANWLVERGAAVRLDDAHLSTELLPTIRRLSATPDTLANMAQASRALARDHAATEIAAVLVDYTRL